MKKILSIILVGVVFTLGSCDKFIECDLCTEDPNNPTVTTPDLLLAVIEVETFSSYVGNLARYSSLWTQQLAGTSFQMEDRAKYIINEQDLSNEWNQLYADGMINCKELVDRFGEGNPYYSGIAKVLWAMNLGLTTDMWGDVPYSDALQGQDQFEPAFDPQQSVIQGVQTLLDEAIVHLSAAPEDNLNLPSSADYIFGGDPVAWTSIAYVLKARYANRLSNVDASASATEALSYLNMAYTNGFASSADDANAQFGTAGNELNQWYAFQQSRTNYLKMGAFMVDLMISISDPRLPFYATLDDNSMYSGSPLGISDLTTSNIGSFFASAASPAPMVTYVEAKFIEAEANFRAGNLGPAATAHNEAISAHVLLVTGAPDPTFEAAEASETAGTITLEKIMTHKYISSFTQAECWADWRRTDIPALTPDPRGVTQGPTIPRRLIIPQDELVSNPNAQSTNLINPVWWDQ